MDLMSTGISAGIGKLHVYCLIKWVKVHGIFGLVQNQSYDKAMFPRYCPANIKIFSGIIGVKLQARVPPIILWTLVTSDTFECPHLSDILVVNAFLMVVQLCECVQCVNIIILSTF